MELHKLEEYNIFLIESLIKNEIEESINVEFKSGEALSKIDAKKKEISKDVAAMANSNGGIIIYGIIETNHKAASLSFIDGNEFSKEWLEQVISSTIQRNIPGLKIFPIRKNNDIKQSIYVVQIPESIEAPHISRDKKFYKRYNFEAVAMEEYEIRHLYGRKTKAKLIIAGYSMSLQEANDDEVVFICESSIINEGDKSENDYKVNVYFEYDFEGISFSWRTDGVNKNNTNTRMDDGHMKVTCLGSSTIYPNEKLTVVYFNYILPRKNLEDNLNSLKIKFRLYYPDGEDECDADLTGFYEKIAQRL
jgi:hypothetical protein